MSKDQEKNPLVPARLSRHALAGKKDQRVRYRVRQAQKLVPHLENIIFRPILEDFCRVSVLLQDSYEILRVGNLINPDTGELRSSIDTVRKLVETHAKLAEKLGLTPTTLKALSREKLVDIAAKFAEVDDDGESE
jgi:hypothetical protein